MADHPEFYWVLGFIIVFVSSIVIKIVYDWLKNRPEPERRESERNCPLDRKGLVKTMEHADHTLDDMTKKLDKIDSDIGEGVTVAKSNAAHYEDFIKGLSNLDSGVKQMISEMKLQTQILLSIKTNGNGRK